MASNVQTVFQRPSALKEVPTHYCAGCHHGTVHRLVAEAIDQLGAQQQTIGIGSVGCSVLLYDYFDIDVVEAPHGRAPAVATGVKHVHPDSVVFTYQGDGDLAAIGTAEIIHAANRGELITVIFLNNTTYGMTGGQMAPTTLPGQVTTTSPYGRDVTTEGHPIRMAELLAMLGGTGFSARVAVDTPKRAIEAGRTILKAFEMQKKKQGFAFVEVLGACPTNWGMSAIDANARVEKEMMDFFPLGVYKDVTADGESNVFKTV
ncbi:MAG: 2-oxoglutarate/2-oxoacid ferredoxin oxidoreductase subunit beta [Desulfuromonadales bacterium]|jgi:2-oxoglutarate ferredoxin oxidoreductase subunit beta|nr:2-oxoglutarate/2-oxoacid ferredoxin oxidoreductase subunit beta [Desulfuromonadales bacterium]